MPNVAIFGGAFNPVHWGHLLIAETAFDQFKLDRVIWVPTFRPPHKHQTLLAYEHRLEMVRLAIADHPAFVVFDRDEQQGTSYAIATLKALQAHYPHTRWYWIIGNDAFQKLPQWQASQELAAQCIWLVAPRTLKDGDPTEQDGNDNKMTTGKEMRPELAAPTIAKAPSLDPRSFSVPTLQLQSHWLQMPSMAISSSLIRQWCREGRSLRYWLPENVRRYIIEKNLYSVTQDPYPMS